MKTFLTGLFLILIGILLGGVIALTTAPPRGEPITLLPLPTPRPVTVDVAGAVARPGPVSLAPDARVQDALDAAGGLLPEADLATLNRAAPLTDGMQILVPARFSNAQSSQAGEAPAQPSAPLNLNTATAEELATLPGIGPVTAQRIIEYRTLVGPFTTVEDLTLVFGIGTTTFRQIQDLVTVGP